MILKKELLTQCANNSPRPEKYMNNNKLITAFLNALGWNAFSYGTYKVCSLLLSYTLYATLNQKDFATWATLMSFIFFWLLMLDCGLRKSVPRFCPEFSSCQSLHRRFVGWICAIQIIVLLGALPFFYWLLPHFFQRVHVHPADSIFIVGTILFFLQGCLGLMRIVYHAHFWNKQFNSLATSVVAIECLLNLLFCFLLPSSWLLQSILITNCIGALCVTVISFCTMPHVTLLTNDAIIHTHSMHHYTKQFIIHTLFMWGSNTIKALSERNFLFPYVLYSLGPTTGIAFKLTNDAALFFYRLAVKTVGINDTALLSYARHSPEGSKGAFSQLVRTIISMVVPLIAIALGGALLAHYYMPYRLLIVPFCLFICGYMTELLLSPYERILEVSLSYKLLSIAYIPYVVMLACLLYWQVITLIGLVPFIAAIQALRIMSALIMVYYARRMV